MKENHFIFADLSTYDLKVAESFYSKVFDWEYHNSGNDYLLASIDNSVVSGLYETPKKFKEMNMPSFWMSYIQVNDLEQTVKTARELGGIIELVDNENTVGKIALIRDPSGAGFTVYEGNQLNSRTENVINTLVWNELFVSDILKVSSFYQRIFNWKIKASDYNRYFILNAKNEKISAIQQVSNEIKGKYEYWGVFFGVESVKKTKEKVLKNGGSIVYEDEYLTCLADAFGAFFQIIPVKKNKNRFWDRFLFR